MLGNFLSCSKGVKDLLEVPEVRCDYLPEASAEMGVISPGVPNLLIFSSCRRCSRLKTGTLGTRSGGLKTGPSPSELLGVLSGFLFRRCWGLSPCVESGPEHEDSSPVLTWILEYFWSLPKGVSPRLEWGHARALSSEL